MTSSSSETLSVNPKAAAYARIETEIARPAEEVYAIIAGFSDWPEWNPGVHDVLVNGPVQPGTHFSWKVDSNSIKSVLKEVVPGRSIGWHGKTMGIRAVHR